MTDCAQSKLRAEMDLTACTSMPKAALGLTAGGVEKSGAIVNGLRQAQGFTLALA